jgi:hypothetical protein
MVTSRRALGMLIVLASAVIGCLSEPAAPSPERALRVWEQLRTACRRGDADGMLAAMGVELRQHSQHLKRLSRSDLQNFASRLHDLKFFEERNGYLLFRPVGPPDPEDCIQGKCIDHDFTFGPDYDGSLKLVDWR